MVGFGKNLAKKRKELHFSQNKLSEKLELCEETIKNYERGEGILLHRAYKILLVSEESRKQLYDLADSCMKDLKKYYYPESDECQEEKTQ